MPLILLLVTPEEVLLSCDGAVRHNVEPSLLLCVCVCVCVFVGDELVSM